MKAQVNDSLGGQIWSDNSEWGFDQIIWIGMVIIAVQDSSIQCIQHRIDPIIPVQIDAQNLFLRNTICPAIIYEKKIKI